MQAYSVTVVQRQLNTIAYTCTTHHHTVECRCIWNRQVLSRKVVVYQYWFACKINDTFFIELIITKTVHSFYFHYIGLGLFIYSIRITQLHVCQCRPTNHVMAVSGISLNLGDLLPGRGEDGPTPPNRAALRTRRRG